MVNYERWARPNLICPCPPAADGPHGGDKTSSSEQMARNDDGDKLQALEALQCDKKWLSYGPARPGGFFAATARSWLSGQTRPCRCLCFLLVLLLQRSGTGLLASCCAIATASLDLLPAARLRRLHSALGPSTRACRACCLSSSCR